PEEEKARPSAGELADLRAWIVAGAPDWADAPRPRGFVPAGDVLARMRADREALPEAQRRTVRYFTLAPQYNAGWADDEMQTLRVALAKLLNSVSKGPRVVNPAAIDPEKLLLRIDARDYGLEGWR